MGHDHDVQAALGTLLSLSVTMVRRQRGSHSSVYVSDIRSLAAALEKLLVPNKRARVLGRSGAPPASDACAERRRYADTVSGLPAWRMRSSWLHDEITSCLVMDLRRYIDVISATMLSAADDKPPQLPPRFVGHLNLFATVANLLDIADSENGRLQVHRRPYGLDDLFERVAKTNRVRADLLGARISYISSSAVVNADRRLLERAIASVVELSLDRVKPGAAIELASRRMDTNDEIAISIQGLRVTNEDCEQLLEKPALRGGTKENEWHLALFFCRRALEAHGGEMKIDRETGGAVFRLTLPNAELATIHPAIPLLLRKRAA